MLVMSRRAGEAILIGDEIEIVIAHIGRTRVKVGIRAPRQTPVMAREMRLVREENMAAASSPSAACGKAAISIAATLSLWNIVVILSSYFRLQVGPY